MTWEEDRRAQEWGRSWDVHELEKKRQETRELFHRMLEEARKSEAPHDPPSPWGILVWPLLVVVVSVPWGIGAYTLLRALF